MLIDERWERLTPADWDAFAKSWLADLRGESTDPNPDVAQSVVLMNFTAKPEQQWQFILAAVSQASDEELEHIAAGPVEHLLSSHGTQYIDLVEQQASSDLRFARMLTGVWRHLMSDAVWARLEVLKARYGRDSRRTSG